MNQEVYSQMHDLEKRHWWFSARRSYIEQVIKKFLKYPGQRALEVGVGTGGNIPLISRYFSYHGIECSDHGLQFTKEENVEKGCLPMDFKKRYDAVFVLDVLEHIEDDASAIDSLYDGMSDNGRLFVSVPAHQWLWSGHDEAHHHFRRYSMNEIACKLESAGFIVEYKSFFYSFLFPAAVAQKLLSRSSSSSMRMPSRLINIFLEKICDLERKIFTNGNRFLPGTSIFLVARKPVGGFGNWSPSRKNAR